MLKTMYQHDDNELGPTTDLSLSLLAMMIIILVLVLIGNMLLDGQNNSLNDVVKTLDKDLKDSKIENETLGDELTLSKELYKKLLNSLNATENTNGDLNATIVNLMESLEETQKQANEYKKKLLDRKPIVFKIDASKKTGIFSKGSSIADSKALTKLIKDIYFKTETINLNRFNLLRIDGHASPEPHKCLHKQSAKDCNMELSAKRAIAVTQFLYQKGTPYECVVPTGYGRTRSKKLMKVLEDNGITLEIWDKSYANKQLNKYIAGVGSSKKDYKSYFDTHYKDDRRVDIVLAFDKDSKCKTEKLLDSLKKIATAYL